MITFDLLDTPAESDIGNYFGDVLENETAPYEILSHGVLVVKNDIPQLFIPIPQENLDDWSSLIRIDPNNIEEITKTTRVYSGIIDEDLMFIVDKKLF